MPMFLLLPLRWVSTAENVKVDAITRPAPGGFVCLVPAKFHRTWAKFGAFD